MQGKIHWFTFFESSPESSWKTYSSDCQIGNTEIGIIIKRGKRGGEWPAWDTSSWDPSLLSEYQSWGEPDLTQKCALLYPKLMCKGNICTGIRNNLQRSKLLFSHGDGTSWMPGLSLQTSLTYMWQPFSQGGKYQRSSAEILLLELKSRRGTAGSENEVEWKGLRIVKVQVKAGAVQRHHCGKARKGKLSSLSLGSFWMTMCETEKRWTINTFYSTHSPNRNFHQYCISSVSCQIFFLSTVSSVILCSHSSDLLP